MVLNTFLSYIMTCKYDTLISSLSHITLVLSTPACQQQTIGLFSSHCTFSYHSNAEYHAKGTCVNLVSH